MRGRERERQGEGEREKTKQMEKFAEQKTKNHSKLG